MKIDLVHFDDTIVCIYIDDILKLEVDDIITSERLLNTLRENKVLDFTFYDLEQVHGNYYDELIANLGYAPPENIGELDLYL